jgi:hypothetical protein
MIWINWPPIGRSEHMARVPNPWHMAIDASLIRNEPREPAQAGAATL